MRKLGNVMVFMGFILFSGLGFIYFTEGAEAFSTEVTSIHDGHDISAKDVTNIFVNSGSTDVRIVTHSREDISVQLDGEVSEKMKEAFKLSVAERNGTLKVAVDREKRPSFTVFAINKGTQLTITVPEKLFETISVKSSSGDVQLEDLNLENLHLKASSGDILVENTASDEIMMSASSGDITAENITSDSNLYMETKSGDISLQTNQTSYTLNFEANSGDGEVKVPGFIYDKKAEERITGKLGEGQLGITVKTKSGDFQLQ
jgi:lia operon protein LiaG